MVRSLKIFVTVAIAFLTNVAMGQVLTTVEALTPIERPTAAPRTVSEAVQQLRIGARPRVINSDSDDDAFQIPIAGNTAGSNGTYFRSDVVIANYRSVAQRIAVGWMEMGKDNGSSLMTYFTIPANTLWAQDDFVGASLNKSGLGGILVFGVTSTGSVDSAARLDGYSRIWTNQPGAVGTVSQNFDAVSLNDSLGSLTAYVVGLKQTADFRSNVGVVNLDSVTHTWTITSVNTGAVTTVTVPPYSVMQTGVAAGSGNGNFALTLKSNGSGFWWSAYASSTDNHTGDGWVCRAKQ